MIRSLFYYLNAEDKKLFTFIKRTTGVRPSNLDFYKQVFVHRSLEPSALKNNERLELLGDSVLDLAICEFLYKKYPYKDEGFLTALKSKMVNRKLLNSIGIKLGLVEQLQTNKRTMQSGAKDIGGNTFEALIGAIYLDKGLAETQHFIRKKVLQQFLDVDEIESTETDYKSKIYQYAQRESATLDFRVKSEEMRNKRSYFTIELFINDEVMAVAEAYNKKEAEQLASMKTIQKLSEQGVSLP